jgi:hypothetical protein
MAQNSHVRRVYLATALAAIGIFVGFALAAGFTTTTTNVNQNGWNAVTGNTVWSGATVTFGAGTSAPVCTATTSDTPTSPAATSFPVTLGSPAATTLYYGVAGTTGPCAATDYAEAWTLTLTVSSAATDTDLFVVYTTWTPISGVSTAAMVADQMTMTMTGSGSSVVTLTIVVDYGMNPQPATTANIDLVVTGS